MLVYQTTNILIVITAVIQVSSRLVYFFNQSMLINVRPGCDETYFDHGYWITDTTSVNVHTVKMRGVMTSVFLKHRQMQVVLGSVSISALFSKDTPMLLPCGKEQFKYNNAMNKAMC